MNINIYLEKPKSFIKRYVLPFLRRLKLACRAQSVIQSRKLQDSKIASPHQVMCLSLCCLVPLLSVVSTLPAFEEATLCIIN